MTNAPDSMPQRPNGEAPPAPRPASAHSHSFATRAVHIGSEPEFSRSGGVSAVLDLSTTYKQTKVGVHSGFEYSRSSNPTRLALERSLASLEGGDVRLSENLANEGIEEFSGAWEGGPAGVAFSSGSAATATVIQAIVGHGGHMISVGDVYGGTSRYQTKVAGPLQDAGCTYVDMSYSTKADGGKVRTEEQQDQVILDRIEQAIRPETKLIWAESPTNPMLSLVPIQLIAKLAKKHGVYLVIDNTFASPYLQQPLSLGADVVVASSTKYLGGHSDVVGGLVVTPNPALLTRIRFFQNAHGAVPSPFDSMLLLRSIKTLPLRVREHSRNGLAVARWLEEVGIPSGLVRDVRYPGLKRKQESPAQRRERHLAWDQLSADAKKWLSREGHELEAEGGFPDGGMVSFHINSPSPASQTDSQTAETFLESLEVFTLAESLGGVESLAELPLKMTHGGVDPARRTELGIDGELIRLSVGVEDVDDLLHDLQQAFKKAIPSSA
ncbi:hypothetical protein C6P46_002830 [Rhodotorula mucilaginosa]|uniref:cystathionine gamma-lyase n=1 Tax=Rhodotorula mucilaginosa TaxID=5537 RepID=A0A9P7B7N7_RHOMI|nr:hypothetical protein C6P46_002830 [Rhodotorula mucilaginosa]